MRLNLIQVLVSLLFYISLVRAANVPLIYGPESSALDPTQTILNAVLLLLLIGYLFLKNDYRFVTVLCKSVLAVFFIGFICCSIVFSISAVSSIKYILALTVISVPPIIYMFHYGIDKFLKSLALFISIFTVVSFAYIFVRPQYGIMPYPHEGLWRGMMEHKNLFGSFCAVSSIILLHQIPRMRSFVLKAFFGLAYLISAICVIKAGSATGLLCFVVVSALYITLIFLYKLRNAERFVLVLGLFSALPIILIISGPIIADVVFELTGRDATLTGRTDIWYGLWQIVMERPVFGHGAGMAERADYISQFQDIMDKPASSTHNSYLSLMINFGLPLSTSIILFVLFIFFQGLLKYPSNNYMRYNLALAVSLMFAPLLTGFAETGMIFSRSIFWVYMLSGIMIIKSRPMGIFPQSNSDQSQSNEAPAIKNN